MVLTSGAAIVGIKRADPGEEVYRENTQLSLLCFSFTHTTTTLTTLLTSGFGVTILCDTSGASYNLTQLRGYLPGDSIRSHRLGLSPTGLAPCQSQLAGPWLLTTSVQLGYNAGVCMSASP